MNSYTISAETEIQFILKILRIKSGEPVATVTELGLNLYRTHPDIRVRKAISEYLASPLCKPIAKTKEPALV